MKSLSKGLVTGVALAAMLFSGTAHAAQPPKRERDLPLVAGPATREVESAYAPALMCLKEHLTPAQKQITYAVGSFPDKTGKVNYASESGSGTFMTQATEDMLVTSLATTGVQVVDMSPAFRQTFDWIVARAGGKNRSVFLETPDVSVFGSLSSLDFVPGGGGSVRIGGVGGGHRKNSILAGFDARAIVMPFSKLSVSARALATFAYRKQIVGYENEAGITSFFGNGGARTLLEVDFGKVGREPVQHVARSMMDVVAYRTVRDINGFDPVTNAPVPWVATCDQIFQVAETDTPVEP